MNLELLEMQIHQEQHQLVFRSVSDESTLGGYGWIAYRVDGGSWNSIPGENNTPDGSNQEVTVPLAPFA